MNNKWLIQVDDNGKVELPLELCRYLLKNLKVRTKNRRIQRKVIKKEFNRLLLKGLESEIK